MAFKHEYTVASGPFAVNPVLAQADVHWIPYLTTGDYAFELFDVLGLPAGWSLSGGSTGTAQVVALAEPWTQNDKVLELDCVGYQSVDIGTPAYFAPGVSNGRYAVEFTVDLRDMSAAGQFDVMVSSGNNEFRVKFMQDNLYIWSENAKKWVLVYDQNQWPQYPDIQNRICKFRFTIEPGFTCFGYVTIYDEIGAEWIPFLMNTITFAGGTNPTPSCDAPPRTAGECHLRLSNTGADSTVRVDHVKVYKPADPALSLSPTKGILGEPPYNRYEIHMGTTEDFIPVPGTLVGTVPVPPYSTPPGPLSFTVPGIPIGRSCFIKVLVVDDTNGTFSQSNEIEFLIPKPAGAWVWSKVVAFVRWGSWLWGRISKQGDHQTWLWVRAALSAVQSTWVWTKVVGDGGWAGWVWGRVSAGRTRDLFVWARAAASGVHMPWLWATVVGIRSLFVWVTVRVAAAGQGWLWGRPAIAARRGIFLWVMTEESDDFIIKKRENAIRLLVNVQWQQQLHGDSNS